MSGDEGGSLPRQSPVSIEPEEGQDYDPEVNLSSTTGYPVHLYSTHVDHLELSTYENTITNYTGLPHPFTPITLTNPSGEVRQLQEGSFRPKSRGAEYAFGTALTNGTSRRERVGPVMSGNHPGPEGLDRQEHVFGTSI